MAHRFRLRTTLLLAFFLGLFLSVNWLTPAQAVVGLVNLAQAEEETIGLADTVQKTVLDNGLTVLTKEVKTAPVVNLQVWYRVGAKDEPTGLNGISHLLEHMLFKGTNDRPVQFGRLFSALGSQFNAFTSYDNTVYFNTVERNKLDALLTLEADRMVNALINEEQLASEKQVVVSEIQGYQNSSNYRLDRAVMQNVFPNHPYGMPIGGTRADVESFTVEQVRDYYQQFYSPDNATLVLVGDFETDAALDRIQAIFGELPGSGNPTIQGALPPKAPSTVPQNSAPIVLNEPGAVALLQAVYPVPNLTHPDTPALDVLNLVLNSGRSSRLYQALVESGLATSISSYPLTITDPGWYDFSVTAAPNKSLTEIRAVLEQTIAELQQSTISEEELTRAKTKLRTDFLLGQQEIERQAFQIGSDYLVAGDYQYSDRYLNDVENVTREDIQQVAQRYLAPVQQTIGFFEPTIEQSSSEPSVSADQTTENFSPGAPVDPAEVAQYLPPVPIDSTPAPGQLPEKLTLANGFSVLLLPDPTSPAINLRGWVDAGSEYDGAEQAGIAGLTAANLLSGTTTQTALEISTALEDRGAGLSVIAGREGVSVFGLGLAEDLPLLVNTLADVLQNATFPAEEIETSRQRSLSRVQAELSSSPGLARRMFIEAIYPDGHPAKNLPTEESLNRISVTDVQNFHDTHYRPEGTILTLMGNFDSQETRLLLNEAFGDWEVIGDRPSLTYPELTVSAPMTLSQTLPGQSEAIVFMGSPGISRFDSRFYAVQVLNQILGGDTLSSRLGTEIRDRQGLTYGVYSQFSAGKEAGPFVIVMQTDPRNVDQAIDSTVAILRQLQEEGITATELDAAKRTIAGQYPISLASPGTLTNILTDNAVYGFPIESVYSYPDKIEAVTAEQVQQAIDDLIQPDQLIVVTVTPDR